MLHTMPYGYILLIPEVITLWINSPQLCYKPYSITYRQVQDVCKKIVASFFTNEIYIGTCKLASTRQVQVKWEKKQNFFFPSFISLFVEIKAYMRLWILFCFVTYCYSDYLHVKLVVLRWLLITQSKHPQWGHQGYIVVSCSSNWSSRPIGKPKIWSW